jgi:hypothetical protein
MEEESIFLTGTPDALNGDWHLRATTTRQSMFGSERTWHNHETGMRQVPQHMTAYAVVVVRSRRLMYLRCNVSQGRYGDVHANALQVSKSPALERERRACGVTKGGNRRWDQLSRLAINVVPKSHGSVLIAERGFGDYQVG